MQPGLTAHAAVSVTADGRLLVKPSFCIDGEHGQARLRPCGAGPTQRWTVHPTHANSSFAWLRNAMSGLCLRLAGLLEDGTRASVVLSECALACDQLWHASKQAAPHAAPLSLRRTPAAHSKTTAPSLPKSTDRIFCMVLTNPASHATRAKAINNTWGRECTHLVFVTSLPDASLPVVVAPLPAADTRETLWAKTRAGLMHAYEQYLHRAEWFCKFDDDTLVVVPHLRAFLSEYSPAEPHFFGRQLFFAGDHSANKSYYSGGAGYVLSRAALQRLGDAVRADPDTFVGPWNAAGACAWQAGTEPHHMHT